MLQPLQIETIIAQLDSTGEQPEVTVLQQTDSSNDWCMQQLKSGRRAPFVCFAETQSAGKGRRGRHWSSPKFANIYMSLCVPVSWSAEVMPLLSLAMGDAVQSELQQAGVSRARLKWPNDVLVDDKKIAGVLIEASHTLSCVIIGIGLNVDMTALTCSNELQDELASVDWTDVATELQSEGCAMIDRSVLAGRLLQRCMQVCAMLVDAPSQLRTRLEAHFLHSEPITVHLDSGERLAGLSRGIASDGRLRVEIEGEIHLYSSADISLRHG